MVEENLILMDWSAFISAAIGGALVVIGQVIAHYLLAQRELERRVENRKDEIVELAMEVAGWLQYDQHQVVTAGGQALAPTQEKHPIYRLTALIRRSQPALISTASDLLGDFQSYFQLTRIVIPNSRQQGQATQLQSSVSQVGVAANKVTSSLNKIIATFAG